MAFTTVSSIKGGPNGIVNSADDWTGIEMKTSYFYPEDINIVLSQENVVAIQIVPAVFASTDGVDRTTLIAIGLVPITQNGQVIEYQRKNGNDDLIALFCGRFNHIGGVFLSNQTAKIDPNRATVPVN